MKIQEITVHAGRTFNHPYESYSNFKPGVSLRATLEDGDDPETAIKTLQAKAEQAAEQQKEQILADLAMLRERARRSARLTTVTAEIARLQVEKTELERADTPALESDDLVCTDCDHPRYDHYMRGEECQREGCPCQAFANDPF